MAYGFAQLHPIEGVFGAAGLFLAYVTELFEEYQVISRRVRGESGLASWGEPLTCTDRP